MIKVFQKFVVLLFMPILFSCGGGEKAEELISEEEHTKPTFEESKFNAQNVFNTLPDRQVVLKLIDENQLEYNPDHLNNPAMVKQYATELDKALNLGIYGSDLIISSSFNQMQESIVFLKCVNVLAGNLGVNSAFDQKMFERIEANNNNKDSVLEIVTEAFRKVDEILKYNNRPATSAIILAGCWIEGLYVSSKMAADVNQSGIIKAIISQRESLNNLIVMLESVKLEEGSLFVLTDLKNLYKAFEIAETTTKYDKTVIAEISKLIAELRTKITKS